MRRSPLRPLRALLPALLLCAPAASASAQDAGGALDEDVLEPLEFRLIGPVNPSGRVTALAVDPRDDSRTIWAGFASSGVWKTTNNGTTWEPVFDDQGSASVGDLAVAPSDPEVVWVGTGERNSLRSNSWGDGVYRSTDGGLTWEHRGLEETRETGRIAIHPEDPDRVWVAALGHLWGPNPERGVYRTRDGGESWEKVLFVNDTTGFVDLKMDPSDPDVLYAASWHRLRWGGGRMEGAGAGSGIWKTTDGGDTWTHLTDPTLHNGLPDRAVGRIGLAVALSDPSIVYAVIQVSRSTRSSSVSTHGGVFRSDDAGATWRRVHDVSAVPDYYYNEVWVDPSDPDRIYLGATRLAVSEDGGETFDTPRLEGVHVDHHALWIDAGDSDHMVLGNDGGVYVSWDRGETWMHQLIPAGQFYETDVDTTKVPYHVCGGLQDNGTWCGPARTREEAGITEADWYTVWGGDGFHHAVSADDPRIRFGESQYGNFGRLNTETMERMDLQPLAEDAGAESGYAFRWDWNTPFLISHHDPTVLYLGGNHLFRLTNRGDDWTILGPDMTRGSRVAPSPDSAHTSYRSLHSIAESTLDPDVLWTGSNDGLIWVSPDGGETWRNVTENIPREDARHCWVAEIEASSFDAQEAFVAYDCHRRDDYRPHVFHTTDAGRSWASVDEGLPDDGGSYVIRQDFVNPDLLFAGTEWGVWVSNDRGERWVRLGGGLPTVPVRDMELVRRTSELVVGTYGRSVWVLPILPLQGLTPSVMASDAHLFPVKPARQYRTRDTYGSRGDMVFRAENPAYGATIWYWLAQDLEGDVRLRIRSAPETVAEEDGPAPSAAPAAGGEDEDADGRSSREASDALVTLTGPGTRGLHRVQWDLRRAEPRPRRLGDPTSSDELRRVETGTYEVTLEAGEERLTRPIVVEEGWEERTPGAMR